MAIACILSVSSYGQLDLSLQGGIASHKVLERTTNDFQRSTDGKANLNLLCRVLKPIGKWKLLGAAISYEQADLTVNTSRRPDTSNYNIVMSVKNNAQYLVLSPFVGIRLGNYNLFNFYAGPQIAFLTKGTERTGKNVVMSKSGYPYFNYEEVTNSSDQLRSIVLRVNLQAEQLFPLTDKIRFVVSEGYSYNLTNTTGSKVFSVKGPRNYASINSYVLSFRLGVSYTLDKPAKKAKKMEEHIAPFTKEEQK